MNSFLESMGIIFTVILAFAGLAGICAFFSWLGAIIRKYRDYSKDAWLADENERLRTRVDELEGKLAAAQLPQSAFRGPEPKHACLPRPS